MSERAAKLVGVAAALGLGGCTDTDPCDGLRTFDEPAKPSSSSSPIVLSGEWIGSGVLELQFSEPLSTTTAPDPARFALINWSAEVGESYNYYYSSNASCRSSTRYTSFGGGGYSYYYQSGASILDVWIAPEDPSVLRLRTVSGAPSCRSNTDIVADGLMLVYVDGADAAGPQLLEESGDPVKDLGPAWAIQGFEDCIAGSSNYYYSYCGFRLSSYATGHLPSINTLAPIPCPS